MPDTASDIFIHGQGRKPKVVSVQSNESLREVLLRAEVAAEELAEALVFVGECLEALDEPEDHEGGADIHMAVEIDLTIEVLELHRHRHVHVHKCRHVAVDVHFMGQTKARKFSPATTIETVTQWARKKFRLDPASSAEYVLQIHGTTDRPRPNQHLGEIVTPATCSVSFDLVKEMTPQG
jgi:hypothetical protein